MKKLLVLLFTAMLVLSGCTKQEEKKNETVSIPEEALGFYYEQIAGRGNLSLDENGLIIVDWSSSASEKSHWQMQTEYDAATNRLTYKDGLMSVLTFAENGSFTEDVKYEDGTGYFTIDGDKLLWHNDKKDNGDNDIVFVRNVELGQGEANMPNPWIETTDLNAAIKEAGFEFELLTDEVLPQGVSLKTYMAMPGILSAIFEGNGNNLLIRKSNSAEGKDLAGDFNEYSKTWSDRYKGIDITCEGDGKMANLAYFDIDGEHFSISYNAGNEGNGLTIDQVGLLSDALKTSGISK